MQNSMLTAGAFYSHEALMGVSCKDGSIRESNVLVNLETGAVTDPDTCASLLGTAETQRIAQGTSPRMHKKTQRLSCKKRWI